MYLFIYLMFFIYFIWFNMLIFQFYLLIYLFILISIFQNYFANQVNIIFQIVKLPIFKKIFLYINQIKNFLFIDLELRGTCILGERSNCVNQVLGIWKISSCEVELCQERCLVVTASPHIFHSSLKKSTFLDSSMWEIESLEGVPARALEKKDFRRQTLTCL
ncbi:transmembrane protein, putative (macronuclear) [Tetrahymena thermophila SB210]|uniref:Transmembrane protein, putative n=1 Tax=Tetrahymena thermophila (strain SB210) TaxID=312017 RepID=W7XBJ4_TETTS|nr:transmembrane protein, putative [Tetrahymena thermophila SB210]EWS74707.1 transmembrane protein, putative [Tetrahymena thermophila SB210]|eukprot:XP_012652708.1 transmembrane protein, putative [Tetrahymena thermophila SB210]